jgi:superfamily II helicase
MATKRITPEMVRKVMRSSQLGIDNWTDDELEEVRKLSGVTLSLDRIRRECLSLRKNGKIGPVLNGTGPVKISDLVCPHCGKKRGYT